MNSSDRSATGQEFIFPDGSKAATLEEALRIMQDNPGFFKSHIKHLANWTRDALGKRELAQELKKVKTLESAADCIRRHLDNKASSEDVRIALSGCNSQAELNAFLDRMINIFAEFSVESTEKLKKAREELNNQTFHVAVVANMSAGKSTFLNALFGDKILPSQSEATTDCPVYIYSDDIEENNKAVIYHTDKRIVEIPTGEIMGEIQKYSKKDSLLREGEEGYKNVGRIDLHWDFKSLQNSKNINYKFVFIDTPGPNNTGEYSDQHKERTRAIVRDEADLALFLFNYADLDANLTSDDQGLWALLKRRKEEDELFQVFFIINQIDRAFNDLQNDISESKEQDEVKVKRELWMKYESRAIQKLKDAAVKQGFENPIIFPVSSYFAKLHRMDRTKTTRDHKKSYERFREDHFEEPWGDTYEHKFIEYLGIEALETMILDYMKTNLEKTLLNQVKKSVLSTVSSHLDSLERDIKIFEQDIDEARANLDRALKFLKEEAPKLIESSRSGIEGKKKEFIEEVERLIRESYRVHVEERIEEMVLRSALYAEWLFVHKNADKLAKRQALDHEHDTPKLYELLSRKEADGSLKYNLTSLGFKAADYQRALGGLLEYQMGNARLNCIDGYKMEQKRIVKEMAIFLNGEYNTLVGHLKQQLNKTLGLAPAVEPAELGDIPLPELTTSVPASAFEEHADIKYVDKQVTKKVKEKRSFFNPRRLFDGDFYWEERTVTVQEKQEKQFFKFHPHEMINKMMLETGESVNERLESDLSEWSKKIEEKAKSLHELFEDARDELEVQIEDTRGKLGISVEAKTTNQKIVDRIKSELTGGN